MISESNRENVEKGGVWAANSGWIILVATLILAITFWVLDILF